MALVCLSRDHKFPWSFDIFLVGRLTPFGCLCFLQAWSPSTCTWWEQVLGVLLSLCVWSCTHPSLPLSFTLFWKPYSFSERSMWLDLAWLCSLLALTGPLYWSAFVSPADLNLPTKGLQLWWASRIMDVSMVRAPSWAVLLLNHKFLRSLMTSVLSWCDGAASPIRCRGGGLSGWMLRCCHSRTVYPRCKEQLALSDSSFLNSLWDLELSCTADWILEVFFLAFGCDCSYSPCFICICSLVSYCWLGAKYLLVYVMLQKITRFL